MKLQKVNRDIDHNNQPIGTYRDANNLALSKNGDYLRSEYGSTKAFDLDASEAVKGVIKTNEDFVLFTIDTFSRTCVYLYRNNTKTTILKTSHIPYNIDPIQGEFKYNKDGELIVMFYCDSDIPRILNIDDLGFELDSSYELVDEREIVNTQLFASFTQPIIDLVNINTNSGNLVSGVYYLCIQYKLKDDSYTNFSLLSNPIYVYDFNPKDNWYNIFSGESNKGTSKSISVNIQSLDRTYRKFRFGIIHKSQESINAYVTTDYITSSGDVIISNKNTFTTINLDTLLVDNVTLSRIKASTIIDNRLYVANVKTDDELKYQKYACNINSEFVYEDTVALEQYKGSYKDEIVLFNRKSFMPFEVYAFYIRFIKKSDGSPTTAYHIPGRAVPNIYNVSSEDATELSVYGSAKKWHMKDYSGASNILIGDPNMGLWENANETYPDDDEFDGTKDYNGNVISGGRNLTNSPVRHHRFPSIRGMEEGSADVFGNEVITQDEKFDIVFDGAVDFADPNRFDNTYSDKGYFENSRTWVNTTGEDLTCDIKLDFGIVNLLQIATIGFYLDVLNPDDTVYNAVDHTAIIALIKQTTYSSIGVPSGCKIRLVIKNNLIPAEYKFIPTYDNSMKIEATIPAATKTSSKIFGVKFSNITIPDYIKEECSHYEILYAERTSSNMSVLSTGFITKDEDYDSLPEYYRRAYSFDLLATKAPLNISYIRPEINVNNTSIFTKDTTTSADTGDEVVPVKSAKYIINDIGYVEPDNTGKEEFISIELEEDLINDAPYHITENDKQEENSNDKTKIVTFMNFNPNLYTSFINQTLVRTGQLVKIDGLSTTTVTSPNIYGGDAIVSLHGNIHYKKIDDDTSYCRNNLVPQFSISNIGYRYATTNPINLLYPKHNLITGNNTEGIGINETGIIGTEEGTVLYDIRKANPLEEGEIQVNELIEYYGYENVLNAINNIKAAIVYNSTLEFINEFKHRIHRSIIQSTESSIESWRTFKTNEYYDSLNNKGEIVQLDTDSKELLVEHKFSLLVLRALDELQFSNGVISAVGDSDIFYNKPNEIIPTDEGYVGCQSKFGSIRTEYGNTIIDRQRGKIFIYNNGKVEEITKYGLSNWMEANLNYDLSSLESGVYQYDDSTVITFDDGENVEYSEQTTNLDDYYEFDNPYFALGVIVAYDKHLERLIITRKNRLYIPSSNSYEDKSWTWSYYFKSKAWISRSDLTPNMIFNNRKGIYGIDNFTADGAVKGVYKILHSETPSYYNISIFESTIDAVFNQPFNIDKKYLSFSWNTTVSINNIINYQATFGNVIVYTYNKHSNNIKLTLQTYDAGNVRNADGVWRFNDFINILDNKDLDVIAPLETSELQYLNVPSGDEVSNWYDKSPFVDTFICIRLIYDNANNRIIKINDISSLSKQINRI